MEPLTTNNFICPWRRELFLALFLLIFSFGVGRRLVSCETRIVTVVYGAECRETKIEKQKIKIQSVSLAKLGVFDLAVLETDQ